MSWQRPSSELRASDAERERVVNFLREHALAGRLSNDELEERIGAAYAAVTRGDLERLIGDLPRRDATPARHRPQRAVAKRQPNPVMVLVGMMALVLPMAVMSAAAVALVAVFAVAVVLGPFVIVALILVAVMRRRRPPPRRSVYG